MENFLKSGKQWSERDCYGMPLEEGFQGRFPGGSLSVLTQTVLYSTFLFCFKLRQPRQSHPQGSLASFFKGGKKKRPYAPWEQSWNRDIRQKMRASNSYTIVVFSLTTTNTPYLYHDAIFHFHYQKVSKTTRICLLWNTHSQSETPWSTLTVAHKEWAFLWIL